MASKIITKVKKQFHPSLGQQLFTNNYALLEASIKQKMKPKFSIKSMFKTDKQQDVIDVEYNWFDLKNLILDGDLVMRLHDNYSGNWQFDVSPSLTAWLDKNDLEFVFYYSHVCNYDTMVYSLLIKVKPIVKKI